MAGLSVLAAGISAAGAEPDDTWAPLGALPATHDAPVFALAADPADGLRLLAGTSSGEVLGSADGGVSWRAVAAGLGRGVAVLAFDPGHQGVVWAGTRGAGVWRSADGGGTWEQQAGTDGRSVRAIAFSAGAVVAGGDRGVLVSRAGGAWTASGLPGVRVSALVAWDDPAVGPVLVAGGDASQDGQPLPLFTSGDAGRTWALAAGAGPGVAAVSGSRMVTALAVPAAGGPLLMATDGGMFASPDRGATWSQLTGEGVLPGTDFTGVVPAPGHPERVYVASDGGASNRGGLWASGDGGAHFTALQPPQPEVTALAVSGGDVPRAVVATFRPSDHAVALWSYRDTGGQPQTAAAAGPAVPSAAPSARPAVVHASGPAAWRAVLLAPETPFLAVGAAALAAVLAALVANALHGRRRGSGPPA